MTRLRIAGTALSLAAALGACASPGAASHGSPTPITSESTAPLTVTRAKIRLVERYDVFWCDPDVYPVARPDENARAKGVAWYDAADKDSEELQAIREHLGLAGRDSLTDAEKYRVYQEHKELAAITLTRTEDAWAFTIGVGSKGATERVSGTVDEHGAVREIGRAPGRYTCPICLSGSTMIDTPLGAVVVRAIAAGSFVWTAGRDGARVPARVLRVVRRPAAVGHLMLRLVLADGRTLVVSPRHPAVDGRPLGSFAVRDALGGSRVAQTALVVSAENATYDLLPAGPTGVYWANGIPIGSTLAR